MDSGQLHKRSVPADINEKGQISEVVSDLEGNENDSLLQRQEIFLKV